MNSADMSVLLVDDHFVIRQIVCNALSEAGIVKIDLAQDGEKALALIEASLKANRPYDIVLLDWNMPKVCGIDVLDHIRSQRSYDRSAVAMLTAAAEKRNVIEAIRRGATSYILKPASVSELAKRIAELTAWCEAIRADA